MLKNRILRIAASAACLWMLMASPAARAQQASGAVTGAGSWSQTAHLLGVTQQLVEMNLGRRHERSRPMQLPDKTPFHRKT